MSINAPLPINTYQATVLEQLEKGSSQPKRRRITSEESASPITELADIRNLFAESEPAPTALSSQTVAFEWLKSIPENQLNKEILSIITQASKERLSPDLQRPEMEQWHFFVKGIKPEASEEDKQNAAQGLLFVTQNAFQHYSEKTDNTIARKCNEIQWEIVKRAIGPDSSEKDRIAGAKVLYKFIIDRENIQRPAATDLFLIDRFAMLSIIEKASEFVLEGRIQDDQEIKTPNIQQHRWGALFKGIAQNASHSDQIAAAENLLILTKAFSKGYNEKLATKSKKSSQDDTYRQYWTSIYQAMMPGAPREVKLEGVDKLVSIILRHQSEKKRTSKKRKVVKKDCASSNDLDATLLVINKASKYLVYNYQWNKAISYDQSIQNPRWKVLLKGITSEASEKEQEEAAKSVATLTQDFLPRYAQENGLKQSKRKSYQRQQWQQWDAISQGIMPEASQVAREKAAKQLNDILEQRNRGAKSHEKGDLHAKSSGQPTLQPSLEEIPDDCLLSPRREDPLTQEAVNLPNDFDIDIFLNDSAFERQTEDSNQSTPQPSLEIPDDWLL